MLTKNLDISQISWFNLAPVENIHLEGLFKYLNLCLTGQEQKKTIKISFVK